MRLTLKSIALAGLLTLAAACGHDNNGNGGNGQFSPIGNPASVNGLPAPGSACAQPSTISPTYVSPNQDQWGPYRRHHINPYSWSPAEQAPGYNFGGSGLCGCGPQAIPACAPQGLACVPVQPYQNYQVANWGYQGGQFGWNNYNTPTTYPNAASGAPYATPDAGPDAGYGDGYRGLYGNGGSCPTSVAQLCNVGSVAGNAICQPASPNSPYGVWVQH